jgi:hypothetical protein
MALSLRAVFRRTPLGFVTQMQKCLRAMNRTLWRFLETSNSVSVAHIFSVDVRDQDLVIVWRDDDKLESATAEIPYSYLRDNSHFSLSRAQSNDHAYQFGTSVAARHVAIGEDGQQLIITWSDGSRGCFQSSWLLQHRSGTDAVSGCLPVKRNLWDSSSFSYAIYGLSVCLSWLTM